MSIRTVDLDCYVVDDHSNNLVSETDW